MDLLQRLGSLLPYVAGGVLFTGAIPMLLRKWRARQAWTRVRATVMAIDADDAWLVDVPAPGGPRRVKIARFGEGDAAVGDTLELHHPPGRPDEATNGGAFGYLAAAGLSALLAFVCWGLLFRGT